MPRTIFWIFGGILTALGVIGLVVSYFLARDQMRYDAEATTAEGTVIGREIDSDPEGSDDYYLEYEFTTADGTLVRGRDRVDERLYDAYDGPGPIDVEYIPSDPASNRVAGRSDWTEAIVVAAICGTLLPIGVVLTIIAWRRTQRHRRLTQGGIPARASVVGHEVTSYSVNDERQWAVVYQYTDVTGTTQLGRSDPMPMHAALTLWPIGSEVSIRYDGEKPEESVFIGVA